jgi:hypothetical protein
MEFFFSVMRAEFREGGMLLGLCMPLVQSNQHDSTLPDCSRDR